MIRLLTPRKVRVALCALVSTVLPSFEPCFAQPTNEELDALPLTTAFVPSPGQVTQKTFYATVQWQGQEYHAHQGTIVLMEVITDLASDSRIRVKALQALRRLRNRDTTPQLLSLYDNLRDGEEKAAILQCLTGSEDPRALSLFYRVLDNEEDARLSLSAATGLAQWNIRRGVAELVELLESDEVFPQPVYRPYVRDRARDGFLTHNRLKGWGFPDEEVRKAIEGRAELSDEQKGAPYFAEMKAAVKKWFEANKHRFPDWKPSDPLPAASELPPIPPGPESVLSLSAAFSPRVMYSTVGKEKDEEVSWQGKRYPAREGVDLLMKVALEPGSVNDRILGIRRLERLGSQLRNTERIPQLMKLYGQLTDRSEKVALLFCLAESKDQRALPLFGEILDTRQEEYLRLPAAYGLALWNVRCGVRELIGLLSVKQTESPIRYPGIIGDEAARLLLRLNYWKSWWAPEAPLLAATEAGPEVRDELLDSCHAELKKWFAANQHRFPDWKLGDPLPKVPAPDADKSAGE